MAASERRLQYINDLHRAYSQGGLHLLIGAGVSVPSGFPSWDILNQKLLLKYIGREHGEGIWTAKLPELAAQLYELFGRDGTAQFVRLAAKDDFFAMLGEVLYSGRQIDELPLNSLL